MLNLNPIFLSRMQELLKDEYPNFLSALNMEAQKGIVVNTSKITVKNFGQIADFKIEPISYDSAGFYIQEKLGKHPLHHAGAFYIQEPSAMFTVNCTTFSGSENVLDMCASPGGKSIQIANRIPNGTLVSNEINKSRCEVLYSNIERMGLKNVIIANDSPENIASAYQNCFDVVLVDAPCGGEGMFRRGEDVVKTWNASLKDMCASRQLNILLQADKALKQGGKLIYSTCTYSYEENEGVIKQFLAIRNYKLVNINFPFDRGVGLVETVRLYPHKVRGEGQFVALLIKLGENTTANSPAFKPQKFDKEMQIANKFIEKTLKNKHNLIKFGNFYYIPANTALIRPNVNYLSVGVRAGEVRKGVFVPNHYLFSAFGSEAVNQIELNFNSLEAKKYIRGETLNVNGNYDGYGAIIFNGCPIGGFKLSNGQFKNHYPKGLREI